MMNKYRIVRKPGWKSYCVEEQYIGFFGKVKTRIMRVAIGPDLIIDNRFDDQHEAQNFINDKIWADKDRGVKGKWQP